MTSPRIIERTYGTQRWYIVSAIYATPQLARFAWDEVERRTRNWSDRDSGIYRHGSSQTQGRVVSAVSMNHRSIVRLAGLLRHGADNVMDDGDIDALIARRARVVLEHAGQGSGRMIVRRPDNRGAQMTDTGEMIEPDPPQG